ncbi:hypothetical protein QYE76_068365 [Lolium multiflorum]|uniref:Uncharacterized protein n=1 Tax=Lolium multiflorum TaxID=4521 RepID=A0AAD8SED6_LOLMU|nr:hypothetical protein QYE76_068365 [Lolium multiflorum]
MMELENKLLVVVIVATNRKEDLISEPHAHDDSLLLLHHASKRFRLARKKGTQNRNKKDKTEEMGILRTFIELAINSCLLLPWSLEDEKQETNGGTRPCCCCHACLLTHTAISATYSGIGGKMTSRIWKRRQVSPYLASDFGLEGLASDCNLKMVNGGRVRSWMRLNFARNVQDGVATGFCRELGFMCQASGSLTCL